MAPRLIGDPLGIGGEEKMKGYDEDFQFVDGVLQVRLSGEFPKELLSQGKNLFQPLIDACTAQECKTALVDARDLKVDFDTVALFQAGNDAAFMARLGLKVALVARKDMIDSFFYNVAYNRGGDLGVFTDLGAARAWLEK
jgi:hypothetical protein